MLSSHPSYYANCKQNVIMEIGSLFQLLKLYAQHILWIIWSNSNQKVLQSLDDNERSTTSHQNTTIYIFDKTRPSNLYIVTGIHHRGLELGLMNKRDYMQRWYDELILSCLHGPTFVHMQCVKGFLSHGFKSPT